MESTALTARLAIPLSRSQSKPLSPSPFAGARRLASVPLSSCSGRVVLLSRGGREYAGGSSSVFAAAAASGEAADAGSEAILLSVQSMVEEEERLPRARSLASPRHAGRAGAGPGHSDRLEASLRCAAICCASSRWTTCIDNRESRSSEPFAHQSFCTGGGRIRFLGSARRDCSLLPLLRLHRLRCDYDSGIGFVINSIFNHGDICVYICSGRTGMMCDGCSASVKRILESQPEVTSATVDFKQASAVVWITAEAKSSEDWQKQCGEKLAKHLGTCGFESLPCKPNKYVTGGHWSVKKPSI